MFLIVAGGDGGFREVMPTKAGQEILGTNHGQGAAMDMVQ